MEKTRSCSSISYDLSLRFKSREKEISDLKYKAMDRSRKKKREMRTRRNRSFVPRQKLETTVTGEGDLPLSLSDPPWMDSMELFGCSNLRKLQVSLATEGRTEMHSSGESETKIGVFADFAPLQKKAPAMLD